MLLLKRRRQIDWWFGKCQLLVAGAVVAFGAVLRANPAQFAKTPFIQDSILWMQANAWIVVIFGPIVVAFIQWGRRQFGSPWAWEAIQKLLDEFRNEVFGDLINDPLDHHRVTLFKYSRFCPGWSNPLDWCYWLVAVARSDHLTKGKIRRFRAPDDAERCEGVVGRAWRSSDRVWVLVPNAEDKLPVINKDSSGDDIESYAHATGVTAEWVRKELDGGRPLAFSYAALLVRLKGQPWGVLVLDSRAHGGIDRQKLDRFMAYGNLLTPLLERT